jgi:hypothetical protein
MSSSAASPIRVLGASMLALLLHAGSMSAARADIADKYNIFVGGNITTFNTGISITSKDESIDEEIDLENDLGLDSDINQAFISFQWRLAERHRIRWTFTPYRRSSSISAERDLDVGDNIIKAGSQVDTTVRSNIYDFDYLYSFYKTPKWEHAASIGIYWMSNQTEIQAVGAIIDSEGDVIEVNDFETRQNFIAPLPLIGYSGSYELNSKVRFHVSARYLKVEINNIGGRLLNLTGRGEYYFTKHIGAGLAIEYFDLDAVAEGIVFDNRVGLEYFGARAYLAFRWQ